VTPGAAIFFLACNAEYVQSQGVGRKRGGAQRPLAATRSSTACRPPLLSWARRSVAYTRASPSAHSSTGA